MARRENLNITRIKAIKPPASGAVFVHDTVVRHLSLCVTANGAKTFYRTGRVQGKAKRIKIGRFPEIGPEQARERCAEWNAIVELGGDPSVKPTHKTLGELFDWYLENHAKPHKRTWRRDESCYQSYLAKWSNKRLTELTPDVIQSHLTRVAKDKGKYAANHVRELLRHLYAKAIEIEWHTDNPVSRVTKFKVESRKRFLQPDEVKRFFDAVNQLQRQTTKDFILMCLFTGARRANVCSMRWDEVNRNDALWTIPGNKFKNGETQTVVLPTPALTILDRRKGESTSPWVFPGQGRTGHLVDPKAAWARVRKLSQLEDLRLHDLRRTLGSWQATLGSSLHIIGKSLGHSTHQATQTYARLQNEPVRQSVETAVNAILQKSSEKK